MVAKIWVWLQQFWRKLRRSIVRLWRATWRACSRVWGQIRQNPKRTLRNAGIVALCLFVCLTIAAKLSTGWLASSLERAQTDTLTLQDQLNAIIQPKEIELGQQDLSVDYLLEQTDPATFAPATISVPPGVMTCLNLAPNLGACDMTLGHDVAAVQRDIQQLVQYQHGVMQALEATLEYNPRADLSSNTLNDETIKLRIDSARAGLLDAASNLIAVKGIDDPTKQGVLQNITTMQQALEQFARDKDRELWYSVVDQQRAAILANRQAFWQEHTNALQQRLGMVTESIGTSLQALNS